MTSLWVWSIPVCQESVRRLDIRILEKDNLILYLMACKNELVFPSKRKWKKLVHKEIMEYEIKKWKNSKNGMRNKEELAFYQEVHTNPEPLNMWKLAKKHLTKRHRLSC